MIDVLLGFNWMAFLLTVFTAFLVTTDRSFSVKIRVKFQIGLILSFFLSLISQHLVFTNLTDSVSVLRFVTVNEIIFQSIILIILISLFFQLKKDKIDYLFAGVTIVTLASAFATEILLGEHEVVNNVLCVICCLFYYYFFMQTYKKDKLTRLLLRHNLIFTMDDLANKAYTLVLIDVDNFKIINDKYGHDKGDEVLVKVVNTLNGSLPGKCRLYRYGGDEFVIISRALGTDDLVRVLEEVNSVLGRDELRISYGMVVHNPGEDGNLAITEADKLMYENKKMIKSEDIWDDMTGLFNYRGFLDELDSFRRAVKKDNHMIYLVAVDIERISNINMAYGYTEGNLVIKAISRVIKASLKGRDFIGHLGSDEFVVAVECEDSSEERALEFIDAVNNGIQEAYELTNKDYSVKLDVGYYLITDGEETTTENCVNNVLYVKQAEKENRRKSSLDDDSEYDNQDEELVIDILDNNKLKYAFQPIVSAKDGSVVAYESLMRSDTEPMISPLKILKYAERNKRSYDVEKYTFFNVLKTINECDFFPENARIFINSIPGYMLDDAEYESLKSKYNSWFDRMVIEITEQREVDDEALASINSRRDRDGFNLAIDDYGSGYSNTNSLLRYMPQIVKLDRLLITGIDRNAKKQFFVNSIISFARENDMKILAEGVETESELKTVIRLGVDMIQGYFTAKPSLEIVTEIPSDIRKIIIDENLKVGNNQRMIYTVSESCELSVVQLAMEDYSKINVSGEYVTLVGNSEYAADLVVKVKDGVNCHMTLNNVSLNSVDDEPCIEVGEGSSLVINLEGNNRINAKGIHVPEGSTVTFIGPGNLDISVKGHECYAIGADSESCFGKINMRNSGLITIMVDGENCVGIGGGRVGETSLIDIDSGNYKINIAGVNAVGIGYYEGDMPITIKDCEMNVDFRVNTGVVIGSVNGAVQTRIKNFNIVINGSGTRVAGIGSISATTGEISLSAGAYKIKLNGQRLYLLGCSEGCVAIDIEHVNLDLMGEGDNVVGFGSSDRQSHMRVNETSVILVINASNPLGLGIVEENPGFKGHLANQRINGEVVSLGD